MTTKNILCIDDNDTNLMLLEYLLEDLGHRYLGATSMAAAVETLRDEHVDLVLLDLMMPDMDGAEATRLMRGELGFDSERLPIIVVTAAVRSEDHRRALECGADDLLTKPIDEDALARLLARYLGD